jgi:hypothetical protein
MWKVRLLRKGGVWNRKKDESIKPQIGAWPKKILYVFFSSSGIQNGFKIASGSMLVAVLQVMNILSSIFYRQ